MILEARDITYHNIKNDELSDFIEEIKFNILSLGFRHHDIFEDRKVLNPVDYRFIYCSKGEIILNNSETVTVLKEGNVALLKPYNIYLSQKSNDKSFEYYYINFNITPAYMKNDFDRFFLTNDSIYDLKDTSIMRDILKYITTFKEAPPLGVNIAVKISLIRLLLRLSHYKNFVLDESIKPRLCADSDLKLINSATSLMVEQINEPIQIKALAETLNVSESKLYKVFQSYFGVSPSKYNMEMKISHAQELVCHSNLTLCKIAEDLGFNSQFHFSKVYKDTFGVTPTQHRKKHS